MAAPASSLYAPSRPSVLGFLLLLLLKVPARVAAAVHGHTKSLSSDVACGRRVVQGKILGGSPAAERRWPWQVSVHYAGSHVCGGSILNEYWVLSAAHCFGREKNIKTFDIYVGINNITKASKHTQWFEVNKVILHPTYEKNHPVGGDLALVQLKTAIEFSDSVLPVCIAPSNFTLTSALSCWATGWGIVSQQGATTNELQETQMPLITKTLCQILYGNPAYIQPDMLCAGDIFNVKTVCEGDSGGPLVCELNHTWLQIGIVSWGRGCSQPLYPGVFARVSYFSRWIRYNIEMTQIPTPLVPSLSSALGAAFSVLWPLWLAWQCCEV